MAGQVVLGAEVLGQLPLHGTPGEAVVPDGGVGEDPRFAVLTDRERGIAALVAEGLDNCEIAGRLYLIEGTVRNRISDILANTKISNRTKLAEGTVRNRISDILANTKISNRTKLAVEWLACH